MGKPNLKVTIDITDEFKNELLRVIEKEVKKEAQRAVTSAYVKDHVDAVKRGNETIRYGNQVVAKVNEKIRGLESVRDSFLAWSDDAKAHIARMEKQLSKSADRLAANKRTMESLQAQSEHQTEVYEKTIAEMKAYFLETIMKGARNEN